jgi:hypothetical protein
MTRRLLSAALVLALAFSAVPGEAVVVAGRTASGGAPVGAVPRITTGAGLGALSPSIRLDSSLGNAPGLSLSAPVLSAPAGAPLIAAPSAAPLPAAPAAAASKSVPAPFAALAAPAALSAAFAAPADAPKAGVGALGGLEAAGAELAAPSKGRDASLTLDPLFTGAAQLETIARDVSTPEAVRLAAVARLAAASPRGARLALARLASAQSSAGELIRAAAARTLESLPAEPRPKAAPAGALSRLARAVYGRLGGNAPQVPSPAPDDHVNWRTFGGLVLQRLPSMAAYMLVTIAFVAVAVPVVGWSGYGILISLSPMAGIAASNIMGAVVKNMSARDAMALNTVLRAASLLALPLAHALGIVGFPTLLLGALAEGFLLASILTTEGSFLKVLFPAKQLGNINGALFQMFPAVQVVLGLFLGFGHIADLVSPYLVFAAAALVNLLIVLPIIWKTIPNVRLSEDEAPAPSRPFSERAAGFARRYWKEALFLGGGIALFAFLSAAPLPFLAAYPGLKTALPIAGALAYWISRTDAFRRLKSGAAAEPSPERDAAAAAGDAKTVALYDGRQLRAIKLMSLGSMMYYPLYLIAAPRIAELLVGPAAKGALIGEFLGALFFGSWLSTAARTRFPDVGIPFTGRKVGAHRLVQGFVAALAGVWVATKVFPGAWAIGVMAALLAAAIIALSERLTDRAWIKFAGLGFATVFLPFAVWMWPAALPFLSVQNAMFLSLIAAGVFNGPSFVSLVIYLQRGTAKTDISQVTGIQGSLFNASVSAGYALITIASAFLNPAYPLVLGVMGVMNLLIGSVFWRAPASLPGLPSTLLTPRPAKKA